MHALTVLLASGFCLLSATFATAGASSLHDANPYEPFASHSAQLNREDQAKLEALEQRLKDAQWSSNVRAQIEALNSVGILNYKAARFDEALDAFANALKLCRELGDQRQEAVVLAENGAAYTQLGMFHEALESYKQSLPMWRQFDRHGEAATLGKIAESFRSLGDADEAKHFDQEALAAFTELGDKAGQAATLNNLGLAQFAAGNKKKSIEFFDRARAIYHNTGNPTQEAISLNNIAVAYSTSGDQKRALSSFAEALALHNRVGNRSGAAAILGNIGVVYSRLGQTEIAHDFWGQALSIYRDLGDHEGETKTLQDLAIFDARRGGRKARPLEGREAEEADSRFSLAH